MEVLPVYIDALRPPEDDLLSKIRAPTLALQEHDVVGLSSKVVSISQGRCVLRGSVEKDELIQKEADWYLDRTETPGGHVMHTVKEGSIIPNAGIDPFADHYVLWPLRPRETAEELLAWFKKEYKVAHLYLVLCDSRSVMLRRGVVGMAVAYAGFAPLYDNRKTTDLFGFPNGGSQTNIPDSLAAIATYAMGEGNEQTPLVRIRNAPYLQEPHTRRQERYNTFEFGMEEDIFAPFMKNLPWKKGGSGK